MWYIYKQHELIIPKEFQDWLIAAYDWTNNWTTVVDISWNWNHWTSNWGVILSRKNNAWMMSFDWTDDYINIKSNELNNLIWDMTFINFIKFNSYNNNITFLWKFDWTTQPFNYLYDSVNKKLWYYSSDWQWAVYSNVIDLQIWKNYLLSYIREWTNIKFYVNWNQYWINTISNPQTTNNADVTIWQTNNSN